VLYAPLPNVERHAGETFKPLHEREVLRIVAQEPPPHSKHRVRAVLQERPWHSILSLDRSGPGHSDLVAFSERDLELYIESLSHRWDGNTQPNHSQARFCRAILSPGKNYWGSNHAIASILVAASRNPACTSGACPFSFFSNTGRGSGRVVLRSDMDARLSSER